VEFKKGAVKGNRKDDLPPINLSINAEGSSRSLWCPEKNRIEGLGEEGSVPEYRVSAGQPMNTQVKEAKKNIRTKSRMVLWPVEEEGGRGRRS